MRDDNSRNTIIFFVCAALLLMVYQFFVIAPQDRARQAEAAAVAAARPQAAIGAGPGLAAPQVPQAMTRAAAVAASPRVPIATTSLKGSLSLRGGRIDDLYLVGYRQSLDKNAPPVELLRPEGATHAWFADMGWTGANVPGLPDAQTLWTLAQGSVLAPGKPVTLTYDNGQGLTFTRVISVDDKFMFTVKDTVANTGAAADHPGPLRLDPAPGPARGPGPELRRPRGRHGLDGRQAPADQIQEVGKGGRRPGPHLHRRLDRHHRPLLAGRPDPGASPSSFEGRYRITKTPGLNIFDANFVGQARVDPRGPAR